MEHPYYPDIDPTIFSFGPISVRWYGLAYLVAFALCWWLGNRRADRPGSGWSRQDVSDVVFYGAVGAVLGGRIDALFYCPHPAETGCAGCRSPRRVSRARASTARISP